MRMAIGAGRQIGAIAIDSDGCAGAPLAPSAVQIGRWHAILDTMKRDEKITLDAQYACTFRPEPEGGYTVLCAAFPGLVSYGRTLEEARTNAREALELCIRVYQN